MRKCHARRSELKQQLSGLASRACELEEAQKRLAHVEEQTALALSRLVRLESDDNTLANQMQEVDNAKQETDVRSSEIERRIIELEAAHQDLKGSKDKVACELLLLKAQASDIASRTCELTETRGMVEDLESVVADQRTQIRALSSQLGSPEEEWTASKHAQQKDETERRIKELEAAHQELKSSKEIIAGELSLLKDNTSEMASRTSELRDTRGKVESLEQSMADQAAQIMSLTSKLVGDLSQLVLTRMPIRLSLRMCHRILKHSSTRHSIFILEKLLELRHQPRSSSCLMEVGGSLWTEVGQTCSWDLHQLSS